MNSIHRSSVLALSSSALLLLLAGCDNGNRTAGSEIDAAVARADAAAGKAQVQARAAVTDTEQAARKAAEAAKTAGASAAEATSVVAAQLADQLEDATIAAKVTTGLAADKNLSALKIKVDSRGGVVTLRGPAPTAAAKERAGEIARNVKGVTSVENQLSVLAG